MPGLLVLSLPGGGGIKRPAGQVDRPVMGPLGQAPDQVTIFSCWSPHLFKATDPLESTKSSARCEAGQLRSAGGIPMITGCEVVMVGLSPPIHWPHPPCIPTRTPGWHASAGNDCWVDTLTTGTLSRFLLPRRGSACASPTSGWLDTAQVVTPFWRIDGVFAAPSGGHSNRSNCRTPWTSGTSAAPSR